jgi:hypothetical protein
VVVRHVEMQQDADLPQWKFLQRLICTLGQHGMSSDETSGEEKQIVRVYRKPWRRDIEGQLSLIDGVKEQWPQLFFRRQGPRRQVKLCTALQARPISSSPPPENLPIALFDPNWYTAQTPFKIRSLKASDEKFRWIAVDWAKV